MKPSDKLKKVIWLTRLCAKACGADIVNPNYKFSFATFLVGCCIAIYFSFTIYAVNLKYHEGWGGLLQLFSMVGSVLQGITKLISGITYRSSIRSQTVFLVSLYEKYEKKGKDYTAALNKCITRVRMAVKIVAFINVMMIIVLFMVPVVIWCLTGKRLLIMHFYVPFIDPDTVHGYFLTVGAQLYCLFFGAFGNFAGDMFMLLFFAHVSLMADIMKVKIMELNEVASHLENPKTMKLLLDVIEWHQTCTNYVAVTDVCCFWINTMQIIMSALSIVLSLFIIFTSDWPGSYGYICMLFATMYMYCVMGTLTEAANDSITADIYDIHWYNMSITQQKLVALMLMKSQSPKKITVGGVIPLSVSTGLQVTKTVYSVLMMLVNG